MMIYFTKKKSLHEKTRPVRFIMVGDWVEDETQSFVLEFRLSVNGLHLKPDESGYANRETLPAFVFPRCFYSRLSIPVIQKVFLLTTF